MKPHLLPDWKRVLRKAWSIRVLVLAIVLTGAEAVLPIFWDQIPHRTYALVTFVVVCAAFIARLLAQGNGEK